MSDILPSISTLEYLPNELLMDIFDYVPLCDIYNGFFGLNSRFNLILNLLQNLYLVLDRNWKTETKPIAFFNKRIVTLIVKHDEPIDFSFFPNIRSLKLCRPSIKQCNAIQSHLIPDLEHFYINSIHLGHSCAQLCYHIFATSFSNLHTCRLEEVSNNSYQSSASFPILTNVQWNIKSDIYRKVLNACPQLNHLQLSLGSNIQIPITSNPTLHTHLHRLDLRLFAVGEWWYNSIESLLSMVPNLEYLTFYIDRKKRCIEFPFDSLGHMLTQYVPHLNHFRANILLDRPLSSSELDLIKQYHPLFTKIQNNTITLSKNSIPTLFILSVCSTSQ